MNTGLSMYTGFLFLYFRLRKNETAAILCSSLLNYFDRKDCMADMDTANLLTYVNVITWGICLCIGYVLKVTVKKFPNRFVPLTMMLLGIIVNLLIYREFSAENIFSGMISGILSTGSYEILQNIINKTGSDS